MDWPTTAHSGSRRVAPPAVALELYREETHTSSVKPIERTTPGASSSKPQTSRSAMVGKDQKDRAKEKIPFKQCGRDIQRDGMRRHIHSKHKGWRRPCVPVQG